MAIKTLIHFLMHRDLGTAKAGLAHHNQETPYIGESKIA